MRLSGGCGCMLPPAVRSVGSGNTNTHTETHTHTHTYQARTASAMRCDKDQRLRGGGTRSITRTSRGRSQIRSSNLWLSLSPKSASPGLACWPLVSPPRQKFPNGASSPLSQGTQETATLCHSSLRRQRDGRTREERRSGKETLPAVACTK